MTRAARILTLLVLATLVLVLGLGFRRDPQDIRSAAVGKPAPAFDLPALDAPGSVSLASYRGKVVVVNFFASWCVPCKEEHPVLARVWERYRTSDVVLIGILYQDSVDAGRAFTRRLGTTWPTAVDDTGRLALAFGVFGVPETFFIGADGVIAGRHIGPIDEDTLITGIETLRARSVR
ncbi:MAG TPA: redoxin domain-containing protein [Candidatus Limnocylindria bacterium]|nr:redoxin domain-containing protein [Candidatus Limnocylindria bacterium]